jgi:hypothetical protein
MPAMMPAAPGVAPPPGSPIGVPIPVDGRTGKGPSGPQMSRRQRRRAGRRQWAQSSRTVRHLDVWTVAKVSFIFYLLVLIAVVVASVLLWYVANDVGAIQSIEKSVRTLFDLSKFTIHPSEIAEYTSAGGGVLALAGTLANILAALMYNLISDLVGGIRFQVVDDAK